MEKEIIENYSFNPFDYDENGRRKDDGRTFRDVVKDFEHDFHNWHSTEYALNLYANSRTMSLLAKSNGAEPFMIYGMDLCHGTVFNPKDDPDFNFQMDSVSEFVTVYGIDSAFMTYDEDGYPIIDENSDIFPLTLLIDEKMRDGEIRLATPTTDDDDAEPENVINDVPQKEYV